MTVDSHHHFWQLSQPFNYRWLDAPLLAEAPEDHVDTTRELVEPAADRVAQIHIAGHSKFEKYILDTHDHAVIDPVWKLYERAIKRTWRCETPRAPSRPFAKSTMRAASPASAQPSRQPPASPRSARR